MTSVRERFVRRLSREQRERASRQDGTTSREAFVRRQSLDTRKKIADLEKLRADAKEQLRSSLLNKGTIGDESTVKTPAAGDPSSPLPSRSDPTTTVVLAGAGVQKAGNDAGKATVETARKAKEAADKAAKQAGDAARDFELKVPGLGGILGKLGIGLAGLLAVILVIVAVFGASKGAGEGAVTR